MARRSSTMHRSSTTNHLAERLANDTLKCRCPRVDRPSKQLVDVYHAKLLDGYTLLFEQHKAAFGWGQKGLKFV